MLFNSFQYWIFFPIVAALFYSLPFRFGKILLLLASYVFYMWWDPRFIVLILTSTIVDSWQHFLPMSVYSIQNLEQHACLSLELLIPSSTHPATPSPP
jgi:hypothetical protein